MATVSMYDLFYFIMFPFLSFFLFLLLCIFLLEGILFDLAGGMRYLNTKKKLHCICIFSWI